MNRYRLEDIDVGVLLLAIHKIQNEARYIEGDDVVTMARRMERIHRLATDAYESVPKAMD